MRRRFSKTDDFEEVTINLTPLIDVVFVVLIIFILIAPMLELDRVELAQAAPGVHKERTEVKEKGEIAIHVHKDNTIWVNGVRMQEPQLVSYLKEMHRKDPKNTPQLFHDKKAFFETYQTVKNAVEVAGFDQLDIILKPS